MFYARKKEYLKIQYMMLWSQHLHLLRVDINRETGEIHIYSFKTVVEKNEYDEITAGLTKEEIVEETDDDDDDDTP